MTPSPAIREAFEEWKLAELAAHYAAPCPDEVMNDLVARVGALFEALMSLPATNADDMLLKLFPVLLREMEPPRDGPPLAPAWSHSYDYSESFYTRLTSQLGTVSPIIAEAMKAPASRFYQDRAA